MFNFIRRIKLTFTLILFLLLITTQGSPFQKNTLENVNEFRTMDSLFYFIQNNPLEIAQKINYKSLPPFQKRFLAGALLFKKGKYDSSFLKLNSGLNNSKFYFKYFNLLVKSAIASRNVKTIQKELTKSNINSNSVTIIRFLIYYYRGKYSNALKIAEKLPYSNETNYLLSYCYRGLGKYDKALKILNEMNSSLSKLNIFSIETKLAIGSIYYLKNKEKSALKYYLLSKRLSEQINYKPGLIKANINIAILNDNKGNIKKARNLFRKSLTLANRINSIELKALSYSELGVSFSFTDDLPLSHYYYEESIKLYRRLNDLKRISLVANNLGSIYLNMGNYSVAKKYFKMGLKYSKSDKRSKALNLIGIGDVYFNLSNYSRAFYYLEKALLIGNKIKNKEIISEATLHLASLNFNLGAYNNAIKYFKSLLSERINIYLKNEILFKLGHLYEVTDSIGLSKYYLSKAISKSRLSRDYYSYCYSVVLMAELLLEQNKNKKALEYLQQKKLTEHISQFPTIAANRYLIFAKISKLNGNFKLALELLKKAKSIFIKVKDYNNLVKTNYFLALLYKNINVQKALKYFSVAREYLLQIKRNLNVGNAINNEYFPANEKIINDYVNLLLKQNKINLAFSILEQSKALSSELNYLNTKISSNTNDENKLKKIFDLNWQILNNKNSLSKYDSLKKELDKEIKTVKSKIPTLNILNEYSPDLFIKKIQTILHKKEYFISTYLTDISFYVFIVSRDKFDFIRVKKGYSYFVQLLKRLTPYYLSLLSKFKIQLNKDFFAFNSKVATVIFKTFFAKLFLKIPDNSKIIISPTGALNLLPLEYLNTSFKGSNNYLINKYNFVYIPSGLHFIYLNYFKTNNSSNNILAFGAPEFKNINRNSYVRNVLFKRFPSLQFSTLRYSARELDYINSNFKNVLKVEGLKATESNFKYYSPEFSIIHLATHSLMMADHPTIIFSTLKDSANDGILEPGEIETLNLNANLVILSSCQSGIGKLDKLEGSQGLQKAFYSVGVKSLIITLWDVDDKATSILMKYFYNNLKEGKTVSQALRLAKIKFIKNNNPDPYYWAGFIFTGIDSRLNLSAQKSDALLYLLTLFLLSLLLAFNIRRGNFRKNIFK